MTNILAQSLKAAWSADRTVTFYDFSGKQGCLTFAEFGAQVESIARRLAELGVGPGKVVALMGPTSLELAAHCAAVWSAGATLTVLPTPTRLVNLELFLSETLEKIARSRAGLLLGEEGAVSIFAEMAGIPALSWEQLAQQQVSVPEADLGVDGVALIQFSSGTTRSPQPILLGAEALVANSRAVLSKFPGGAHNHSLVSWLPLYHDMGLIGCFLMPILAPGNLTLMGPEVFVVRPLTWLEALSNERATASSAPNFALSYCAERITEAEVKALDLSGWQIALVGAETVRPKTLEKFAEHFAPAGFDPKAFSPVYGLAEATLAVTFSPLGGGLRTFSYDTDALACDGMAKPGSTASASLGKPLDGVQVEIRLDGQKLPEDVLGDVWIKSESLLSGYLVDGELTLPLTDGWLETGDAGFLHEGDLYLYGRRRDILLLDGRNHDPVLVEEAAESMPELRRCCAFCLDTDTDEKDRLVVLCEVAKGFTGQVEALKSTIRSQIRKSSGLLPHTVELVIAGELPVTSSGKLRRGMAASMYKRSELELVESALT